MYGASPDSMVWFWSYLEEQRQFVKLGHITSAPKPVRQGVPQGSILGPVLFLLLENDMPLHLNNSTTDIYADDTTLSLSANWNNITSLTQALSNDLENIEKWSTENKMYINTKKTKALLVTGKRLHHKLCEETVTLKLQIDATNIDQLSHHKLLRLITDKDLSFEAHIDELPVCKKLSKRLGLLRHISPYLKQRHKLTFYLATIKPVMLYLSPNWSSHNKELLERVLRMQKRAACTILDAERTTRTLTMFNELNCILFFIEAYISRCSIAFKRIEGTTPDYINSILKTNSEIHNQSTCFANLNFHCPVFKKTQREARPLACEL